MSEKLKLVLAILLVIGALVLCVFSANDVHRANNGSAEFALTPAASATAASDFTLPDAATGRPVSLLVRARTHPVVLDFWATWCGPCRMELPHIVALSRKYRGRVGFYGVNFSDSPARIVAFSQANAIPFATLVDANHAAADAYGASAIPQLVVIDTRGRVRLLANGYDPHADIEGDLSQDLDDLLDGS